MTETTTFTTVITTDMIDLADGPNAYTVTIGDENYRVEFEFDESSSPDESECYSEEDIQLWRDDHWYYVGVIVTPLDVPERHQFELSDSLWGLELDFPMSTPTIVNGKRYTHTTEEYLIVLYPVPDMIEEVAAKVRKWRESVNRMAGFKVN